MAEYHPNTEPRRRWYQFTLRTLLILATLLSALAGYVAHKSKIMRERMEMRHRMLSKDNAILLDESFEDWSLPWVGRLVGELKIGRIALPLNTDLEERKKILSVFPEATLWIKPDLQLWCEPCDPVGLIDPFREGDPQS